jgi:SAM-dependent methyltransferase
MSTSTVTQTVRCQYENLPYPPRNPEDDRKRLPTPAVDNLACVNHHCYAGKRNLREDFRVLVAGGGTGDATIYLAWQLRHTNAVVLHLDLSQASIDVARKRARVCNLHNIQWNRGSLLDLPTMDVPPFDYINCNGVLHHLEDPPAGLAALRSVLKDDGAMGLMLYGRIGRTAVYLTQELMRRVNAGADDPNADLQRAESVLRVLPATNWLKRSEDIFDDHLRYGRAGILDAYLHSQDRAYTAEQVHEFLAAAEMKMVTYIPQRRFCYRPESLIRDSRLLADIRDMPLPQQETIMELMWGGITKHEFWAVPAGLDSRARLDDWENVPFYPSPKAGMENLGRQVTAALQQAGDQTIPFTASNITVELTPSRLSNLVFEYIDGRRTMGEILGLVRRECSDNPTDEEILAEFAPNYNAISGTLDQLLLAHKSVILFFQKT